MEDDRTDLRGATGGDNPVDAASDATSGAGDTGFEDAVAAEPSGGNVSASAGFEDVADSASVDVIAVGVDVPGDGVPDALLVDAVATDAGSGFAAADDLGLGVEDSLTGTPNPVYDLVSVLYHSLHGTETAAIYGDDATISGDPELAQFFRDIQLQDRERAERAKALLRRYLAEEA